MDLRKAEVMARDMMRHHGVNVSFGWNDHKRTHGLCRYDAVGVAYKIELSRPITALNSEDTVLNTILHEIAHALAGGRERHGQRWKLIAQSIGAVPRSCAASDAVKPAGRYHLVCGSCGKKYVRYRRTRKLLACAECCNRHSNGRFDARFTLALEVA